MLCFFLNYCNLYNIVIPDINIIVANFDLACCLTALNAIISILSIGLHVPMVHVKNGQRSRSTASSDNKLMFSTLNLLMFIHYLQTNCLSTLNNQILFSSIQDKRKFQLIYFKQQEAKTRVLYKISRNLYRLLPLLENMLSTFQKKKSKQI